MQPCQLHQRYTHVENPLFRTPWRCSLRKDYYWVQVWKLVLDQDLGFSKDFGKERPQTEALFELLLQQEMLGR